MSHDPFDGVGDLDEDMSAFQRPPFAADYQDLARRKPSNGPIIETADDLQRMRFAPISYIVPGFVAEGATILAGRPKLGKSWMMMEAAIAVATGGTCWGNIPVEEGDVLLLALEDNRRRLQRRFDKLMGMNAHWPRRLSYATEWPRASDGGLEHIRNWILKAEKPRLVVVDVLMMFRPMSGAKDSPYEADYHAVKGLQELAGEFGIAIVIVHHTRKGGGEHDPFEKVSGTLGLSGAADSALILDRDGNGATLYGRGRDIEEIESAIVFDKDACVWKIQGEAGDVRRSDERADVSNILMEAAEPLSPSDLTALTGRSSGSIRALLLRMAKADEARKTRRGKYIHPLRTDLVTDDDPVTPRNNRNNVTSVVSLTDYRAVRDGYDEADDGD